MSLKEKLGGMTKDLENEKKTAAENAQTEELKPIRTQIKALEKEIKQLDLIKGSLEIKSGDKIGKGMREVDADTKEEVTKEEKGLDTLIDANKEALQKVGIENRDQLTENADFGDEDEVVSYKKAKTKRGEIKESDTALEKKLAKAGIEIGEFSYDTAEKAVAEKLASLESELLQEKLKTPEGKEEAIETLAENLEKILPQQQVVFSQDEKTKEYALTLASSRGYDRQNISIKNDKVIFKQWDSVKLLPEDIEIFEGTYGKEIVQEALKKAYTNKIERTFKSFDKETNNTESLLEDLERADPKKAAEAQRSFRDYNNKSTKFKELIKKKYEELEQKGIRFKANDSFTRVYEEIADLDPHYWSNSDKDNTGTRKVGNALNNASEFPPPFDWEKLKEKIEKKSELLDSFENSYLSISSQEEMDYFSKWESMGKSTEGTIGKFHQDNLNQNTFFNLSGYENKRTIDPVFKFTDSQGADKLPKDFYSAKKYLDDKKKELDELKKKVSSKLESAIDAKLKQQELVGAAIQENLITKSQPYPATVEETLKEFERQKQRALRMLGELAQTKSMLPEKEILKLNDQEITIPSIEEKYNNLFDEINNETSGLLKKIDMISEEIREYPDKPRLFGVDKWQMGIDKLNAKKKQLEETLDQTRVEIREVAKKRHVYLSLDQYNTVDKSIAGRKIEGTADEIFANLKTTLEETIDRKPPQKVVDLYTEYKALEKQLAE